MKPGNDNTQPTATEKLHRLLGQLFTQDPTPAKPDPDKADARPGQAGLPADSADIAGALRAVKTIPFFLAGILALAAVAYVDMSGLLSPSAPPARDRAASLFWHEVTAHSGRALVTRYMDRLEDMDMDMAAVTARLQARVGTADPLAMTADQTIKAYAVLKGKEEEAYLIRLLENLPHDPAATQTDRRDSAAPGN